MTNKKDIFSRLNLHASVYFVVAIVIIILALPREGQNEYVYSKDRPWRYGLLTAPFDFHIQRSEAAINAERDSLLKTFQPYFLEDLGVAKRSVSQFVKDARAQSYNERYISYVSTMMREIYKAGVVSPKNSEKLTQDNITQIKLKDENNVASTRHLSSFYTPRKAYEKILASAPSDIDMSGLQATINEYLQINIVFDEQTTTKLRESLLQQVPVYEGMVQIGEKIIDRGEIVGSKTFDILNSFTCEIGNKAIPKSHSMWSFIGKALMVIILMSILFVYLKLYRQIEYFNPKSIVFLLLFICLYAILTVLTVNTKTENILYVIPFAISVILIRTFIDSRTAIIVHLVTVLISALMLTQGSMVQFIFIQVVMGYICVFSLKNLSERSQLFITAIFVLATYFVVYSVWVLATDGDVKQINYKLYINFCINFILVTFSYLLIYVCEKVFGFISEVSMIELSNINKPLLQELSEVAPGTFQHSMQVSNLVSAAAVRIGANAVLVRTGALYHDIGKMSNPAFFTENQSPGMNPHANLSAKESAKIIISHVEEGVKIAKKHGLPQQIIDFIETHHGKGKAKFFYNTYKNEHPDEYVDPADFSYPGPNPFSRETALLMMADTVEAASRSLTEYTEESISLLVNKLIDSQISDGLMKNAPITFSDIELAKEVFIDKLKMIYHSRIAYPELKEEEK